MSESRHAAAAERAARAVSAILDPRSLPETRAETDAELFAVIERLAGDRAPVLAAAEGDPRKALMLLLQSVEAR